MTTNTSRSETAIAQFRVMEAVHFKNLNAWLEMGRTTRNQSAS
jgi:hypothetical protein